MPSIDAVLDLDNEQWAELLKHHSGGHDLRIDLLDADLDLTEDTDEAEGLQLVCFTCGGEQVLEANAPAEWRDQVEDD